jgi:hypothetical protein
MIVVGAEGKGGRHRDEGEGHDADAEEPVAVSGE